MRMISVGINPSAIKIGIQEQTTSTWPDESLLDGSVDTREEEGVLKEVLLEEDLNSNNIGLQVEEDDIEERPEDDASGGSSEEI